MLKFKVNGKFDYLVTENGAQPSVNGAAVAIDMRIYEPGHVHILHNSKTYDAELVAVNDDKTLVIKVNGNEYTVAVKDRFDQLLEKMGMADMSLSKVREIKAPMPGLVLNILVEVGQEVKKGDNMVVLEAMKMENILKAPGDGKVAKILIKAGDKLEKNTVLIVFD